MAKIQVETLLAPLKFAAELHTAIIVSLRTSSTNCGRLTMFTRNRDSRGWY